MQCLKHDPTPRHIHPSLKNTIPLFKLLKLLFRDTQASTFRVLTEVFLSHHILGVDSLVRSPHRLDHEETVHALKRNALGFWDKED